MKEDFKKKLQHLLTEHKRLGIAKQLDYTKFYLYSIITHSTAIEGSTVTEVEAQLLFDEGITSSKRTINDGAPVACVADKVTDNVVKAMADKQPHRIVFRDSSFNMDADKIIIYDTFKQMIDWSYQEVVKNIRVI